MMLKYVVDLSMLNRYHTENLCSVFISGCFYLYFIILMDMKKKSSTGGLNASVTAIS